MTRDRRPVLTLAQACPNYRPGTWAPSDVWMVLPPALIEFMREGSLLEEPEGQERIRVVSIGYRDCSTCSKSMLLVRFTRGVEETVPRSYRFPADWRLVRF